MTRLSSASDAEILRGHQAVQTIEDALQLRRAEEFGDTYAFFGLGVAFAALSVVARLPAIARALAQLGKWGWIATFVVVNGAGMLLAGAVDDPMLGYVVASGPLLFSVAFLWVLSLSASEWASEYRGAMLLRKLDPDGGRPAGW